MSGRKWTDEEKAARRELWRQKLAVSQSKSALAEPQKMGETVKPSVSPPKGKSADNPVSVSPTIQEAWKPAAPVELAFQSLPDMGTESRAPAPGEKVKPFDGTAQGPAPEGMVTGHLLTVAIGTIHEGIAKARDYDGWLLTPKQEEMFDVLGNYLVAQFGWKNLPMIFCILGIMGMYVSMGLGDIKAHKGNAPRHWERVIPPSTDIPGADPKFPMPEPGVVLP